jgi:hypothetical protein
VSLRCEEVRDRFSALWENELSPSDQAEIRGHLDLCAECREEFARFDRTLRLLHSAEEVDVPEGFLAGVYEKLEERKRGGLAPAAKGRGWLNLPLRLKLPIQAFAMVAVVFLALYLTKMTPFESPPRVKDATEPKSALLEQKKAPAETQTPAPQEKKLDQLSMRQQENRVKEEEASGRLKDAAKVHTAQGESTMAADGSRAKAPEPPAVAPSDLPAAPAPPLKGEMKSSPSFAGKPAKIAEKGEALPRPEANVPEDKAELRSGVMATPSASGPKADESLRDSRLMAKKAEEASGAGGTLFSEAKPSREFVVKVKDQKETLSRLEELMKRFGGKVLNTGGNRLLVSLPNSSLSGFESELEKVGSVRRKTASAMASKETAATSGESPVVKRRDAKGKDNEADSSVAKEDQVLIQIDLVEE